MKEELTSISYEYLENIGYLGYEAPLYKPHQQCVWKKETEGVQLLINKPIDYHIQLRTWRYQAISLVTDKYVFVWEKDLTNEMS
jgi:hypothetical protein|tara:strand:- start:2651 stop:2902 length:252 start_codon:yes stop_codon:yes gene_type:complete